MRKNIISGLKNVVLISRNIKRQITEKQKNMLRSSKIILTPPKIILLCLTSLTLTTGFILSSVNVSADTSSTDNVSVTVPVSCSLSATVDTEHTAEINNGTYTSNIGTTTLKTFCNDSEGFAIYAIGYTNNEEGNNVLANSSLDNTYDIATGTATSGDTSNWAMKLTPAPGTYAPTIQNSFNSYHIIPSDYTLVASRASNTDIGDNATGSSLTATYAAYVSQTQPVGTYAGAVKYVLVHPNDYGIPPYEDELITVIYDDSGLIFPNNKSTNTVQYRQSCTAGHNDDSSEDKTVICKIENYAGTYSETSTWHDSWYINVNDETVYLENENDIIDYLEYYSEDLLGTTITVYAYRPTTFNEAYANASKSKTNDYYVIQDLDSATCSNVSIGQTTSVMDLRDNEIYVIGKLADGNCWMLDNLRLDPTSSTVASNLNSSNTNAPATAITNFLNGGNSDGVSGWSSEAVMNKTTDWNNTSPNNARKHPYINNTYKNATAHSYFGAGSGKIGTYYNYCAATVGTYCYPSGDGIDIADTLVDAPYDLCPANWRMPTGGPDGEYNNLFIAYSKNATEFSDAFSAVLAGSFYDQYFNRTDLGEWYSSTYAGNGRVYYSTVENGYAVYTYDRGDGSSGQSIRCLVSN